MKNKKKIVRFIFVALAVLIGTSLLSDFLPSKVSAKTTPNDELLFSGYVNKNTKPQFVWRLEKDSTYTRIGTIEIVLETGKKISRKIYRRRKLARCKSDNPQGFVSACKRQKS